MWLYEVFGGVLASELEFPELRTARARTPDWTIRRSDSAPLAVVVEPIGWDYVEADVRVHAFRLANGYRLQFDDTGIFDVSADGRDITWHPAAGADERAARMDVTGRVLALALHSSGYIALHASAASIRGRAIAFLGPKGSGKSTLAVALERAGAELMSDDILPVQTVTAPIARPGAHSVRMFPDVAERLGIPIELATDPSLAKPLFRESAVLRPRLLPAPVAALYLLTPVTGSDEDVPLIRRSRVAESDAVFRVLRETKIGALLGRNEAATVLTRIAALVSATPVYELAITRDLTRLDEVVAAVLEWHSSAGESMPLVANCA